MGEIQKRINLIINEPEETLEDKALYKLIQKAEESDSICLVEARDYYQKLIDHD